VRVGIIVPQGWTGEYQDIEPEAAWQRTLGAAQRAEELGFESAWVFDHFQTTPEPIQATTFEAFTTLAALAPLTSRIRLGQLVTCAGYRNAGLLAKMVSTLDVISGGRVELGLGAGWKADEWNAYGYGFPSLRVRQAQLRDTLEVVLRMFAPGLATYAGEQARVAGAINQPKPLQQPHPPIVVGGNGREVTWRIAARYADELNLDGVVPEQLPEALKVIGSRCEEIGRDPASLRVSVHIWWRRLERGEPAALLAAYRDAGADRVMMLVRRAAVSPDALDELRRAGEAADLSFDDAG